MPRALRTQVLAVAVVLIAAVLGASNWLGAALSDEALRADLIDRVSSAMDRVAGLRHDPARIHRVLNAIVLDNRDVDALRLYEEDRGVWNLVATTRSRSADSDGPIAPPTTPLDGGAPTSPEPITLPGGAPGTRLGRRVDLADGTRALLQADVSLQASRRLQQRLRSVDLALFVGVVALFALVLDRFFRRRVEPRLADVTRVLTRAADGHFDEPIAPVGTTELDALASSLNVMLARVKELTGSLEGRVAAATRELATRNRELEARGEEVRELQAEAVRSQRFAALGQMAATLAHELGTPLNSVLGYAQLLKQDQTNPEQSAKLDIIESQVRRMIEIIRRTLGQAREGQVENETIEMARIVDEVLTLVGSRAAEEDVVVSTEVAAADGPVVVDPIAVRQVMVNLVNNAIDAEGTTTVHIRVSTTPSERDANARELAVEIADDGRGIPADRRERIFEPFYTTKETGRGTGLGLAIVDHLVRSHGGHIDLDSTPGSGTTFRVRFPLGSPT